MLRQHYTQLAIGGRKIMLVRKAVIKVVVKTRIRINYNNGNYMK